MKKVLITGIAGFVGSSLAERLLETPGVQVIGIDSFTDYYPVAIKRDNISTLCNAGVRIDEADLATADLDQLLDGVDTVFHQAGQPGVRPSWGTSFGAYTRDNVNATQRLLEACNRSSQLKRIVYASSSSVYGEAKQYPTYEQDRTAPLSPYGVTKLAAEHLMSLYAANFGVPAVSLRYFTVYGPRQRPDMGFTRFLTRSIFGDEISVYGDGSQIRDFTFVQDIVDANIAAATAQDVASGSVFNISGGSSVALNEVFEMIEDVSGAPLKLKRTDKVPGDVFQTGGDSSHAREVLGWTPRTDLRQGLRQQLEWLAPRADRYRDLV